MYRTLLGILSVFAVAILLVALTFSATLEQPADLRRINGTEPKSLDPQTITGVPEMDLAMSLFEGLLRFDAKTLKPAPGVAESYELSPDGTVYTFKLRANARWSDGHAVTAGDFVYSWKRMLSPALGAENAYMLHPIVLAEAYNTFAAHVEALGALLPSVRALEEQAPLPAPAWQAFLRKSKVTEALRPVEDSSLDELLTRQTAAVSRAELVTFAAALERARAWLGAKLAEARAHFGVDRGVIAKDPRTLVVELRAPTPYFPQILQHHASYPVPRWVVEREGDSWFLPRTIVSNGPFRLARWVVNDHIRLEKNQSYWGRDAVRLERIDMLPSENTMTNVNLYLTGAVDVCHDYFPQQLAPELRKRPDFDQAPALSVYYYLLNVTKKPLDDPRVRKALNLAIDRETITQNVLGQGQVPAYSFVPPGMHGYAPPPTAIRRDLEQARRLLAEAGFPGGKGFPRLGILYNTMEDHKRIAEVVSDQLRRALGIEVTAYNQEWQSYLGTRRALGYDIARAAWVGDYVDPNTFLDMWVTNGPNNQTGWSSDLYDQLIRVAGDVSRFLAAPEPLLAKLRDPAPVRALLAEASGTDQVARLAARERLRMLLFREAEAILIDGEFPIMPIYFYVHGGLARKGVHGFEMHSRLADGSTAVNLQNLHPMRDVWVDGPRSEAP